MINNFIVSEGTGRYIVEAAVVKCGKDLNVTIGGGEKYHIGAVAIGIPRFEYKNGQKRTASTSVICVQGHREDEVAYKAAKYLATALDCTVTVTVGIHVDGIKPEEFKILMDNINLVLEKIINNLTEQ